MRPLTEFKILTVETFRLGLTDEMYDGLSRLTNSDFLSIFDPLRNQYPLRILKDLNDLFRQTFNERNLWQK